MSIVQHRPQTAVAPPGSGEPKRHPVNPTTAWNLRLMELSKQRQYKEALSLYRHMLRSSFLPNTFTFPFLLKSCAILSLPLTGSQLHAHVIRTGSQPDPYTRSSLISMYSKCSLPFLARRVFDETHNLPISYNAMISGYSLNSMFADAVSLFRRMRREDGSSTVKFNFNSVTMLGLVSGCNLPNHLPTGTCLHGCAVTFGLDADLAVMNSFLTMYVKCGEVELARQLFDEMLVRDLISWNAMVSGYAQNGHAARVLELYHEMKLRRMSPDPVTLLAVLSSCANLGAQVVGVEVERKIEQCGFGSNPFLTNALINMYARCGNLARARAVFDGMVDKSVVSWTAIIGGYGIHGEGEIAVELFEEMVRSGVRPDRTVFVTVLSACSHAGLTDKGLGYFDEMEMKYGLQPGPEHYSCLAIAFALLNTRPGTEITIMKNLRVCVDCHIFMKLVSKIVNRHFIMRDATRFHQFGDGVCSCKDYC